MSRCFTAYLSSKNLGFALDNKADFARAEIYYICPHVRSSAWATHALVSPQAGFDKRCGAFSLLTCTYL